MNTQRKYPLPPDGVKTATWIPYGYLFDPDSPALIAIDPDAADAVRYIFKEYIAGKPLPQICTELTKRHIPNPATRREQLGAAPRTKNLTEDWLASSLNQMLFHPVYAGDWILEGRVWDACYYYSERPCPEGIELPIIQKDHHEALISREDLCKAANLYMDQREERTEKKEIRPHQTRTGNTERSPIASMFRCGECGRTMHPAEISIRNAPAFTAYFCSSINQRKPNPCSNRMYRMDSILTRVHEVLLEEQKSALRFSQLSSGNTKDKNYTQLEADYQKQIDQTVDAVRLLMDESEKLEKQRKSGKITQEQYEKQNEDLEDQIAKGEHQVMIALTKIRSFRKVCGEKNAWVSLYSSLPDELSPETLDYRKYIRQIELFCDKEPRITLQKLDAKKQLMETLNLPYEEDESDYVEKDDNENTQED